MKRVVALALLLLAPSDSWAAKQLPNFNGVWQAPFTVNPGTKDEEVQIVQQGNYFSATKITGDPYVPVGKLNFRARYTGKRFPGKLLCALVSSHSLFWAAVEVTIIDKDHFRVEGGCSGDAMIWSREGAHIS